MSVTFSDVFTSAQDAFRQEPAAADATFSVESRQTDGLKSAVTVRQFRVDVDEPAALGGDDTAPNPVEYVLAALASCQEITYRLYADQLGIPLKNVSVSLSGEIDLRGFFAVDDSVRPGYNAVKGTVTLDSDADASELRRLKAAVDRHCPVLDILRQPTPVSLGLEFKNGSVGSAAARA